MDKMGYMKELEIFELRKEGTRETWNYEKKEQGILGTMKERTKRYLELKKEGTRDT